MFCTVISINVNTKYYRQCLKCYVLKEILENFFFFSLQTFFSNVDKNTKATLKIHDEIR